jgi:1,2-diacylglycerol 3-alpha-glucosyltransferase
MKIVHVTGYFAEGYAYQENLLPLGQYELGHDVYIFTSKNEPDFGFNSSVREKPVGTFDCNGVSVTRLDHYFEIVNRMPFLKGLLRKIYQEKPDILFIHDVGPSLLTGMFYKLFNPAVSLHMDCHSTPDNARNSLIGPVYHFLFRVFFLLFSKKFDRFFAIAPETIDFMTKYYGLKNENITLLPLPGDSLGLLEQQSVKKRVFEELDFTEATRIILHSGKLPGDKETLSVLKSFSQIKNINLRLVLAGYVSESFREVLDQFKSNDSRIIELGWVSAATLRDVMLASDLLVQPGSLSNSFIDAICCGLPIILDDTPQGRYLVKADNGVLIARSDLGSLKSCIEACLKKDRSATMKMNALGEAEFYNYVNNARISLS